MESKSYIEQFRESFPDEKKLTDKQRKNLLRMFHNAFVDIRSLTFHRKTEQAYDLADAFHNLPLWLDSEVFSFEYSKTHLKTYHKKHQQHVYNYLEQLDTIENNEDLDGFND